jgi:hypothetical protein
VHISRYHSVCTVTAQSSIGVRLQGHIQVKITLYKILQKHKALLSCICCECVYRPCIVVAQSAVCRSNVQRIHSYYNPHVHKRSLYPLQVLKQTATFAMRMAHTAHCELSGRSCAARCRRAIDVCGQALALLLSPLTLYTTTRNQNQTLRGHRRHTMS